MKKFAWAVWNLLLVLQRAFLIIAGSTVTLLVFTEVMLRYVFGSPLFGVEELICIIAIWLYFIGSAYGAYERTHIKADLIHMWIKTPRPRAVVDSIASAITVVLAAILVSWSYPYFIFGLEKGETSQALLLPMVLSQSAIFFSAILMLLYFGVELIDNLLKAMNKKPVFQPTIARTGEES